MKPFVFSLASASRWRAAELAREAGKYRVIVAAASTLAVRIESLQAEDARRRKDVIAVTATDGAELAREDYYRKFTALELGRLKSERSKLERALTAQSIRMIDARRSVELLERVREKELLLWKLENDKYLQTLADESYSARLQRGARRKH